LKVFNFHNQGQRPYQEDSYHIDNDKNLYIICDGVGGSNAGSTASQESINVIVSAFEKYNYTIDIKQLEKIILEAQEHLMKLSEDDKDLKGMGTTLILFYFINGTGFVAHLGDSRLYHLPKNDQPFWVTKDHSFVQELYDEGILKSELSMKTHPFKNRITKALSTSNKLENGDPSIKVLDNISKGDFILLASDGALESHTTNELVKFFESEESYDSKWNAFEKICIDNSRDNNTAIGLLVT